jgi:hypothetical protein
MDHLRHRWHPRRMTLRLALLATCALALSLAGAARSDDAPWQPGDRIEAFELADAHGAPGRVDERVRLVLFTADMDGGKLVQQALADPALQDLATHGAVYVADVSRMPALVTRLFARPSMRRRPYRTLLDPGPGPTVRMPREPGKVTLLALDALSVRSVHFADAPETVASAVRGGPAGRALGPR